MNDLIQTIKILESNELKIINDYIDTLKFEDCKVFGAHGENHVNPNMRSSLLHIISPMFCISKLTATS